MTESVVPLWIGGQQRLASDGATFEVLNPHDRKVVSVSASASSQDCKDAVEAAQKAFLTWEHTAPTVKRGILLKAADLLESEKYKAKIYKAVNEETAGDDMWGMINVRGSVGPLREAAVLATTIKGESFPSSSIPGGTCIVQRRAYGVILAISPWNAPVGLTLRAIAIPLICGNTVVVKSSELSPRCQAIAIEALHEAGIPPGVVNYLSMSRDSSPKLVPEIIGNPHVRHINFTGSDRVGRIIAGEAAKYLKPCVFELGGKAPAVVLDDANIDDAARHIVQGAMMHAGQICMSTERVIVQKAVSAELIDKVTTLCRKVKAGDVRKDPSVKFPSVMNEVFAENILGMMREAKDAGAEVILGDLTRDGPVIQPHLLKGVKPGMRAWDRESFGPVVGFAVVDTIDEAVELANASDYSLTASLWTRDVNNAIDVASRLRAGCSVVNGSTFHSEVGLGNGGLGGATGYGRFDIDNFTVKRMIVICPKGVKTPMLD
ncbi:aldehyde dehydrogenase [Schizopora paradoxa]|uniref:Aldehyde dehydrogenase n=1 Tax=Schizopora paradoxa TaxID=27342 RepID=A0A0H2SAV5_9AGAM|nr:aldehyde dehydrogenase [Schizopora paradoxa]